MRTLVIGAGVSGLAAAGLAGDLGDEVLIFDRRPDAVAPVAIAYPTASGEWTADLLDRVDRVVVSPGVPEHAPEVRDALVAGIPIISEIELASTVAAAPIVAVTGTNGKTTVTRVLADMISAGGRRAVATGNIGTAFSTVAREEWDVFVTEVSSFQLRFIDRFHPRIAVLLNIAEDHLDWHGTLDAYIAAKANIFRNQDAGDVLIYGQDSDLAVSAIAEAAAELVPVSGFRVPAGGAGPDGSGAIITRHGPIPLGEWRDPAFVLDLAAAASAALELGTDLEAVAGVVSAFTPGPHRRTVVGTWDGITWVDDSKATNPHAARAAVDAFASVVLIAGGRNKSLDLSTFLNRPSVRHVIAIGEAAGEIVSARQPAPVDQAATMEEAVAMAGRVAVPGDTVLLAPGCASFDMFDSYAARGDSFAAVALAHHGVTA
ncbi:MAG: UDP-N-acetylmuramoyl-L-alanine--D-glutamate ligase [Acidimicrobiia bacterium]|nr:UDP-N-acetylmuramoyl-L-alanine--D-glutamate ligase [Acidimicrobiia bacterium]NNL68958.1 UDP-N-acetylmuramoyl-L-alanine--D-glutamate ligase [Acidimicrobiia bacterium]